eukprot:1235790-Amphidinium_carterae.1
MNGQHRKWRQHRALQSRGKKLPITRTYHAKAPPEARTKELRRAVGQVWLSSEAEAVSSLKRSGSTVRLDKRQSEK